ncbi:hypothetical protein ABKA04_002314 [Annulohypoxylon sp. FPYF3050]
MPNEVEIILGKVRGVSESLDTLREELNADDSRIDTHTISNYIGYMDAIAKDARDMVEELASEQEVLLREKEALARERQTLAREKATLAGEKEVLASKQQTLVNEQEKLAERENVLQKGQENIRNEQAEIAAKHISLDEEDKRLQGEKFNLAYTQAQVESFQESLDSREESLRGLENTAKEEKESLEKQKAESLIFQTELKSQESANSSLKEELEKQKSSLAELKEKLDTQKGSNETARLENERREREIETSKNEAFQAIMPHLQETIRSISDKSNESRRLATESAETAAGLAQDRAKLEDDRSNLDKKLLEVAAQEEKLNSDREILNKEASSLAIKESTLSTTKVQLDKRSSELEAEKKELEGQKYSYQRDYDTAQTGFHETMASWHDKVVERIRGDISSITQEQSKELQEAVKSIPRKVAEAAALEIDQEMARLTEEREKHLERIKNLNSSMTKANTMIQEAWNERDEKSGKILDLEKEVKQLKDRLPAQDRYAEWQRASDEIATFIGWFRPTVEKDTAADLRDVLMRLMLPKLWEKHSLGFARLGSFLDRAEPDKWYCFEAVLRMSHAATLSQIPEGGECWSHKEGECYQMKLSVNGGVKSTIFRVMIGKEKKPREEDD